MTAIARLLSVFALVAMIASPAMACCLTGHSDIAGHEMVGYSTETASTTCHDSVENTANHKAPDEQADPECSGCIDCDIASVSQNDLLQPTSLNASQTIDVVVAIVPGIQGLETRGPVLATGPPSPSDIDWPTLVQLKQILLI